MPYYSKDEIEEARSVTLYEYLSQNHPEELKHISGTEYMLANDSYIRVSSDNGAWIDYGCNGAVGGYTAIDYLVKYQNYSFTKAVEAVSKNQALNFTPTVRSAKPKEKQPFTLPEKAENNNRVIKYLTEKRCLDNELVNILIKTGQLYEEKKYHNCVFVGYSSEKKPVYAALRGTYEKRFVGEVGGSDKRCSFSMFRGKNENNTLCICESAIDAISLASIFKLGGKPWTAYSYQSLGGAYKPGKDDTKGELPLSVKYALENNKGFKDILLCLDNDVIGKNSSAHLYHLLKAQSYSVSQMELGKNKDVNDMLLAYRESAKER